MLSVPPPPLARKMLILANLDIRRVTCMLYALHSYIFTFSFIRPLYSPFVFYIFVVSFIKQSQYFSRLPTLCNTRQHFAGAQL